MFNVYIIVFVMLKHMNNEELVSILVPKSLVTAIYGFISAQANASPEVQQEPAQALPLDSDRAESMLRMVNESPPAMKQILRAIAERSPKEITTRELAATLTNKADADSLTVAGTLGAFGRRFKNRHPGEPKPFQTRWDYAACTQNYKMSKEVADQIMMALKNV